MEGDVPRNGSYGEYVAQMKIRTKEFAVRIVKLGQSLPRDISSRVICGQLLRCGTAVGANYRAACRARTSREFTAKIRIVMEESDEALFWLELIGATAILPNARLVPLVKEANELVAIFTSAHTKAARKSAMKPRQSTP